MQHSSKIVSLILLVIALALTAWLGREGAKQYGRLQSGAERRPLVQLYRDWTRTSFLIHCAGGLIGLAILGRLRNIAHFPTEFSTTAFDAIAKPQQGESGLFGLGPLVVSLVAGMLIGLLFVTIALIIRQRRMGSDDWSAIGGATSALLPRNAEERRWWLLLALNAGVSEELYDRLLLPLLVFPLWSNVVATFLVTSLIFGLGHLYQGWRGVASTALIAVILSFMYLLTTSLLLVMVLHVVIDARMIFLGARSPVRAD